jgi:thiol-disulfide isomerase/thioredoxin
VLRWVVVPAAVVVAAGAVVAVLLSERVTPFLPAAQRGCGTAKAIVPAGGRLPTGCMVEVLGTGAAESLATYAAGKPMVINFWASWCVACIDEMPDLQKVYLASKGQVSFLGLDLLGVDGEVRSEAMAFARQRSVTYPLAYDDDALLYGRIAPRFLPPTTAFLRPDGTLAAFHYGQLTSSELAADIAQYLGVTVRA